MGLVKGPYRRSDVVLGCNGCQRIHGNQSAQYRANWEVQQAGMPILLNLPFLGCGLCIDIAVKEGKADIALRRLSFLAAYFV